MADELTSGGVSLKRRISHHSLPKLDCEMNKSQPIWSFSESDFILVDKNVQTSTRTGLGTPSRRKAQGLSPAGA